jgi:hypothetical protein
LLTRCSLWATIHMFGSSSHGSDTSSLWLTRVNEQTINRLFSLSSSSAKPMLFEKITNALTPSHNVTQQTK